MKLKLAFALVSSMACLLRDAFRAIFWTVLMSMNLNLMMIKRNLIG